MADKRKGKIIKPLVAVFILLIVLFAAWSVLFKRDKVDYYTIKPIDINNTVLASGRVSYPQPYDITALSSGRVAVIACREGELVSEGQLLLQMEDFQENQNLLLASSNLESIKSKKRNITEETLPRQEEVLIQDKIKLGEAERELQRQKALFEQGAVPAVDYEKATDNYKLALSQYNQDLLTRDSLAGGSAAAETDAQISYYEAQLSIATKAVADKRVVSPLTGTVSKINFSAGQQVTASEVLLTILRQQNWVVEAEVDQKELPLLKEGQDALVALDAYPQEKLAAVLIYISPQVDAQKGTCLLRLEIKGSESYIKYGMAADVELLSETNIQVLALPRQFLEFNGSDAFAWVWQEGRAVKYQLTYRTVGDRWIIAENLEQGAVILSPAGDLNKVKLQPGREVAADEI